MIDCAWLYLSAAALSLTSFTYFDEGGNSGGLANLGSFWENNREFLFWLRSPCLLFWSYLPTVVLLSFGFGFWERLLRDSFDWLSVVGGREGSSETRERSLYMAFKFSYWSNGRLTLRLFSGPDLLCPLSLPVIVGRRLNRFCGYDTLLRYGCYPLVFENYLSILLKCGNGPVVSTIDFSLG